MTALAAFALSNWRWLLPSIVAAGLAIGLGFARLEIGRLEVDAAQTALDIQKQKTTAATMLAESEKHARAVEARNAELNIKLEKDHAENEQKLNGAQDDNRKLASRLGVLLAQSTGRGDCGADSVPGAREAAGGGTGGAAPGGLSDALGRLIAGANQLFREADGAAEVGQLCHAFANRADVSSATP